MTWTGSPDAPPSVRIASLAPSLHPSLRRVVEAVAADPGAAVDLTAQELAEQVGVGRASVVRAAQSLGYDGYPQLRVALAREGAIKEAPTDPNGGAFGVLVAAVDRVVRTLPTTVSALAPADVERFVAQLDEAERVLVAANGLTGPMGLDVSMRLTTVGRPAEYVPDPLTQAIAARQLSTNDALLALSGSGASRATLSVAEAAHTAGATVLTVTGFSRTPLTTLSSIVLLVPPATASFRDELLQTSRAAMSLVLEGLIEALVMRRGARARQTRSTVLTEVAKTLRE